MNRGGRCGDGYVFFDQAEVRTCLCGALANIRLTGIAMGDCALGNHAQTVLPGGGCES
jgi:hypothetical protein